MGGVCWSKIGRMDGGAVSPRNWLCIITSDKEATNIDEMTCDTWTHFDGIAAVVHSQGGDSEVADLLKERCKSGFVKEIPWSWHHGFSMNHWLLDKRIGLLDACWVRDSSERFSPKFTETLRSFSADLLNQNIWNLAQYSKILMFRRWYNQQVMNGLHWGISGLYGHTVAMERFPQFQDDKTYAYSVRNERRPSTHRYRHELLYILDYGVNGNHLALFHPDPVELDKAQWNLYKYTQFLQSMGVTTADQLIDWWKQNPLDNQHKRWINEERPFRNAYRFFQLGHTNEEILKDENEWRLEL